MWGGVPRYWELASSFRGLEEAIRELVLHRNGVLHEEPMGLLLDEMRSAVQPYSLLTVIGQGCHRLSEIAGRLGKPASSLLRPLVQLVDLGYVRRDTPFGDNEKSTRRSLYKIADPFLSFHFRFVQPNKSQLQIGAVSAVAAQVTRQFPTHVSAIWENWREPACRSQVSAGEWGRARRWWGTGSDGAPLEVDVVAESVDGRAVLVGEAKWNDAPADVIAGRDRLVKMAAKSVWARDREIVPVQWLKRAPRTTDVCIQTPDEVLDCLTE